MEGMPPFSLYLSVHCIWVFPLFSGSVKETEGLRGYYLTVPKRGSQALLIFPICQEQTHSACVCAWWEREQDFSLSLAPVAALSPLLLPKVLKLCSWGVGKHFLTQWQTTYKHFNILSHMHVFPISLWEQLIFINDLLHLGIEKKEGETALLPFEHWVGCRWNVQKTHFPIFQNELIFS